VPPARVRAEGREVVVAANPAQLAEIGLLVAADDVLVTVHEVHPLAQAQAAHEALAQGHFRGKLVLGVA
jgi:NADPH:quinone reductase-like Zn-dependent oxidoreductase